jgi:hypothetical protein
MLRCMNTPNQKATRTRTTRNKVGLNGITSG